LTEKWLNKTKYPSIYDESDLHAVLRVSKETNEQEKIVDWLPRSKKVSELSKNEQEFWYLICLVVCPIVSAASSNWNAALDGGLSTFKSSLMMGKEKDSGVTINDEAFSVMIVAQYCDAIIDSENNQGNGIPAAKKKGQGLNNTKSIVRYNRLIKAIKKGRDKEHKVGKKEEGMEWDLFFLRKHNQNLLLNKIPNQPKNKKKGNGNNRPLRLDELSDDE